MPKYTVQTIGTCGDGRYLYPHHGTEARAKTACEVAIRRWQKLDQAPKILSWRVLRDGWLVARAEIKEDGTIVWHAVWPIYSRRGWTSG